MSVDTGLAADTGAADSGGKTDASGEMDAGKDVIEPPKDSGPPTSTIHCGNASCTSPQETCCRSFGTQYQCTAQNACGGLNTLSILCEKRQNCESLGMPGTVCCAHYTWNGQSGIADKISCTQLANCNQQTSSIVLCDPNDPSQCLQNQTCTLSQVTIPGYYFCK